MNHSEAIVAKLVLSLTLRSQACDELGCQTLEVGKQVVHGITGHAVSTRLSRYCKTPLISPGLIQLRKEF